MLSIHNLNLDARGVLLGLTENLPDLCAPIFSRARGYYTLPSKTAKLGIFSPFIPVLYS